MAQVIDVKNITGWRWLTFAQADLASKNCDAFFGLPIDPDVYDTLKSFTPIPNFNSVGVVEFYYIDYTYPSQLALVPSMGPPSNFDVNFILEL